MLEELCDGLQQFCDSTSREEVILQAELLKCRGMSTGNILVLPLHAILSSETLGVQWKDNVKLTEVCVCACVWKDNVKLTEVCVCACVWKDNMKLTEVCVHVCGRTT